MKNTLSLLGFSVPCQLKTNNFESLLLIILAQNMILVEKPRHTENLTLKYQINLVVTDGTIER